MRVKVRFFSILRDYVGAKEVEVELPQGIKGTEVKDALIKTIPGMEKLTDKYQLVILVNGRVLSEGYSLKEGDEIAVMPPVSGGM